MNYIMLFEYGDYVCWVDRMPDESYDIFCRRGWFIAKQGDPNGASFYAASYDEMVKYSRLWINKENGCVYNDNIMKKLAKMEKNLSSVVPV